MLDQSHASALRVFLLDIRVELDQVTVDELRLQFDCKHVRVDDGSGTNLQKEHTVRVREGHHPPVTK